MNGTFENKWGKSPWRWDLTRISQKAAARIPARADFVVIGGGFSGLSAAVWLGRMAPKKKVVLIEADRIGAGASGRTGGMTLAETAGGDLPGLGDVLGGFAKILTELRIDCDFTTHGALELGRKNGWKRSEISWTDAGKLRVVNEVPGGTVDAGKLINGLTRTAVAAGVSILERRAVTGVKSNGQIRVALGNKEIVAGSALITTNAQSLELGGLQKKTAAKLTMGVATAPLSTEVVKAIGMESRKPFYTVDLPYLWGRLTKNNRAIFGSGLVTVADWKELHTLDVRHGRAAELLASLKERVRGLHPALRKVKFTHGWGGPILLTEKARPIFARVRAERNVMYLGGYNGHGVALAVYLGRWAAGAMLGTRTLPHWNR
jgi:glycine/D-amino acid oxidase-like deaminating enzyme